jgi:hypothetical protein
MEVDWQTMENAPPDGEQFMVSYKGTWYPYCMISDGVLESYDIHGENYYHWKPLCISLDDPKLRWAPQPLMYGH